MTSFRLAFHEINGRRVVEVFDGDVLIAGLYPAGDQPRTFRIVSKYTIELRTRDDAAPVNAIDVTLGDEVGEVVKTARMQ